MIITGSIITAIVVLLVISLILFYNGMVRGRNMVEEAWSGISVQLKRRHDLVPVLVNSVKGYMTHEQETLTRIAELRASAVSASSSGSVQAIAHAENQLMGALRSLFAVSENYPDLRANENFMQLQEQLSLLEDEIQLSRRYYNGTARDQNNRVLQFPGNLVARSFGFARVEYFELADPVSHVPRHPASSAVGWPVLSVSRCLRGGRSAPCRSVSGRAILLCLYPGVVQRRADHPRTTERFWSFRGASSEQLGGIGHGAGVGQSRRQARYSQRVRE